MYPNQYFSLFPPFRRDDKIFVAMSFDSQFTPRWERVIKPAIEEIKKDGVPLQAHRVDASTIGDSILTQILGGIGNDLAVFADVTSLTNLNGIRNGNVMYEVGIAHAVRLPEEVIIFRSDSDKLLFDLANVRVHHYDPDNHAQEAGQLVKSAIVGALRELDLRRHLAVKHAAESLDFPSFFVLDLSLKPQADGGLRHPTMKTMGDAVAGARQSAAIARLLELGALKSKYIQLSPENVVALFDSPAEEILRYTITPFGAAILAFIRQEWGIERPEIVAAVTKLVEARNGAQIATPEKTPSNEREPP
jgi:hypothetical protein